MTQIIERTVLFADLRGSTALYETLGNAEATTVVTHSVSMLANIVPERGGHLLRADVDGSLFEHGAFGIGRAGRHAELHRGEIFLVRIEHRPGEFGRLAYQDQQQAGRERVQRPGMARFLRTEKLLCLLECAV